MKSHYKGSLINDRHPMMLPGSSPQQPLWYTLLENSVLQDIRCFREEWRIEAKIGIENAVH